VRETLAFAAAAAALAGCGAQPEARDASAPATPAAEQPWTLEGAALVRREGRAPVFRLVCAGRELHAELPGVARISSEDRLTVGAGDRLVVLVVSMEGAEQGIGAAGPHEPDFLAALAQGAPLAASYGARQMALGIPAAEPRAQFVAECHGPAAHRPPRG